MRAEGPRVPAWAGQGRHSVRFQWGPVVAPALAGGVCVVVDVLRFTTAVEAAVSRGVAVYPYRWRDATAAAFAGSVGAILADRRDPAGPSLSPSSMDGLAPGASVVLPSPNGSTCAVLAAEAGARVAAGCLRNAAAVAPEARAAIAAFRDAAHSLPEVLSECASGRELTEKGWAADIGYAARLNASTTVPVLSNGAFR